jgi:hypothetical protein
MKYLDDVRRRLRISRLQARRDLLAIEREALVREIDSPKTSPARKREALTLCNDLADRWARVVEEIKTYEGKTK